ncbi:MAG: hypothetical protein MR850_02900 [Bacteroidales bacterium]|nr:hypothetical protein [Bacteroidales bacterium]
MKEELDILSKLGKDSGFKVPENYFADFNKKMMESLPEPVLTPQVKPSLWVRVRPYVYMAAMFAGIWCMMHVFNDMSGVSSTKSQIQAIVNGLDDEKNIDDLMLQESLNEYDVLTYEDSVDTENSGIQLIGSDNNK